MCACEHSYLGLLLWISAFLIGRMRIEVIINERRSTACGPALLMGQLICVHIGFGQY